MKITITNEIKVEDQVEKIKEVYKGEYVEKGAYIYLIHENSNKEKVVLKCCQTRLTMTRFSKPKSVMNFIKNEQSIAQIPTPLGMQQLLTDTITYHFNPEERNIRLDYALKQTQTQDIFANYRMLIYWEEDD